MKTPLFGSRSSLDSMNLVNVITDIEERLSEDYAIHIVYKRQCPQSQPLPLSPSRCVR